MDEKRFQEYLRNKIDDKTIKNYLLKIRDYETFLSKENLNLETLNPERLVEYTEYLVSMNKEPVLEFLRAVMSYASYSKKYEFITEAINIMESYVAMDTLFSRTAELHGETIRDEIFKDLSIPPLGVHPEKKPDFTKIILKRVEDRLGEKNTVSLLSPCLHGNAYDDVEGDKKILMESGIDDFLSKKHQTMIQRLETHKEKGTLEFAQPVDDEVVNFIKNDQVFAGIRDGNIIYVCKTPYQIKRFLNENDDGMKRYYICYCPWVRGAIKNGTEGEISKHFCHCGAGFLKIYWDQIFDESVKVEPVQTALNGALECRFAVYLPEKAFDL